MMTRTRKHSLMTTDPTTPAALAPTPREVHRLRHVLVRERSRIDRAGGVMSLVVFYLPKRTWLSRRKVRTMLEVLSDRLRITDEVGVIDGHRAFALLPDTDALGAEVLARQVQRRLSRKGLVTNFAVFRYVSSRKQLADDSRPQGPPPGSNHHGHGDGQSNGHANGQSNGHAHHDGHSPDHDGPPPLRIASANDAHHTAPVASDAPCLISNFADTLPLWKRALDVTVAGTALTLSAPLLAAVAVAIKLETPGPALFKQVRMGAGRRAFEMYKFRSMVVDAESQRNELLELNEQDGPAFKIRNDPRVTRVGKIIRATSLDELPQLLNVLKGDMTLVGPRPLPVFEAEACEPWHDVRHSVHPGLTCIWQVWGRSRVSFDDWARMDLRYARKRTLLHDMKILAATVPAVVKRDGAS